MDILEQFLHSIAYKFPKGYPDLKNKQDMLLIERELFKHNIDLREGTKAANTRKAVDTIVNSEEGKEAGLAKMKDIYRIGNIGNPHKIDKDRFIEILNTLFNSPKINVYAPKEGPNDSSKYNMFEFELEGEGQVQITLAGGANEGEKYEQGLLGKLKAAAGTPLDSIEDPEVKQIFSTLGIDPSTLTPEDIKFAGASDTSRQLSFDGPKEIGTTIADIVITADKPYYLSIKNVGGSAIYNGGNIPFIVFDKEGKVIFDESKYNNNPLFADIFDTLGIDSQRIADGLNDYINKTGKTTDWESAQGIDINKVKNLLASSFGYGYWYVREKSGGKLFIYHVATPEDAYKMVGDLKPDSIKIKYPGNTSKGGTKVLEVRIETNSEVLEGGKNVPLVYQIVARNAAGNVLPLRMNIRTNK
jgi:hypothetical protein